MEGREGGLEARVEALAREVRWTRRGLAAAAVAGAIALTAGTTQSAAPSPPPPPAPAEVRASRFALVDAAGATVGALEAGPDGMPRLVLSASGAPRATLRLGPGGIPALELRDAGGGRGGVTLTTEGGVPRLALADSQGRDRMWVALRLGSPAVQFLNAGGLARSGLTTFNDDGGVAVISEAGGASPGLVVYGKERTILWSAP